MEKVSDGNGLSAGSSRGASADDKQGDGDEEEDNTNINGADNFQ
jgi:hypothetical protein